MDMNNVIHLSGLVLVAGLIGMVSHYLKKWLRKEIEGSLVDYLLRDHVRETALALMTFLGAAATAIASAQFTGMTAMQIAMASFLLGYASDSAMNKATPKE